MTTINDSVLQKKRIKDEIARIQYLTLYERLGVPENASNDEIKNAFDNKSEICKTKPPIEGANDLYKLLEIAKKMLTDPVSRQIYDAQMKGLSKTSEQNQNDNAAMNNEDRPLFSAALARNVGYQKAIHSLNEAENNYIKACNNPSKTAEQTEKIANLKSQCLNAYQDISNAFWQQVKDRGIPEDKLRDAQMNLENHRQKYEKAKAYGMNSEVAINACKEYAQAAKELRQVFDPKNDLKLNQGNENKNDGLAKVEPTKTSDTHPQVNLSAAQNSNESDKGLKTAPAMNVDDTHPQVGLSADSKAKESNEKNTHIKPKNPFSTDLKR